MKRLIISCMAMLFCLVSFSQAVLVDGGAISNQTTALGLKVNISDSNINTAGGYATKFSLDSGRLNRLAAIALKEDKSRAAYTMKANNTSGTANATDVVYKSFANQTYAGTIVFTGTTAPSGTVNATYTWTQRDNKVDFRLTVSYSVAGTGMTSVFLPLPSDMPTPFQPSGFTGTNAAFDLIGGVFTSTNTTTTSVSNQAVISNESGTIGFRVNRSSGSGQFIYIKGTYFIN